MGNSWIKAWVDGIRGHGRMRRQAWRLLQYREFDRALRLIQTGIQKFPRSVSFQILNARYFLLSNNREMAQSVLAGITDPAGLDVFDQFELAETYRLVGRYEPAIGLFEHLRTAGKLDLPQLASQRLSSIYYQHGRMEEALSVTVDCIRIGGWQRHMLLAQIGKHCSAARVESAISALQAARRRKPGEESNRLKFIAYLAAARGNWELAVESIRGATKRNYEAHAEPSLWDEARPPLRPTVLLIGAMKSGTSALFEQLACHPRFVVPIDKELHFFANRDWPDEFYFEHFPRVAADAANFISGEASPGYYVLDIIERVKRMLPDTKLVFIKRDPVERAVSHLFHNRNSTISEHPTSHLVKGKQDVLDLMKLDDQALAARLRNFELQSARINRYLLLGCYDLLLRRWRRAFGPQRILELELTQFARQTQRTMDRLFEFVGLPPVAVDESLISNVGRYQDDSSELRGIRRELEEFYSLVARG